MIHLSDIYINTRFSLAGITASSVSLGRLFFTICIIPGSKSHPNVLI